MAKTKGIGKLIKERRKKLGLTQREIAEKVDVVQHHISAIEWSKKRMSLRVFPKILAILKLDFEEILSSLTLRC